ncbi:MAG: outer membrane protein transport protein [Planctomycetes bacterium]|nr:outer membrane protein transport protein [Planctomycetota bacterium]
MTRRQAALAFVLPAFLLQTGGALASNGARMIASGTRSNGRGGTDVAIADDASAINTNPAGLGFGRGARFDQHFAFLMAEDRFQTDRDRAVSAGVHLVPTFGYAFGSGSSAGRRARPAPRTVTYSCPSCGAGVKGHEPSCPNCHVEFEPEAGEVAELVTPGTSPGGSAWRFGFGVFPLGGGSSDFNLRSDFFKARPNFDRPLPEESPEYQGDIAMIALGPSVARRLNDRWSLGFTLRVLYGRFEKDVPVQSPSAKLRGKTSGGLAALGDTYADVMQQQGFHTILGKVDMDETAALGWGAKLGLLYRPNERLSWGLAYEPPSLLDDFHGNVGIDYNRQIDEAVNALPGGLSRALLNSSMPDPALGYAGRYNLTIKDFQLPQSVTTGLAHRPTDRLLWAVDLTWINWSMSMDSLDVVLEDGDNPNLNTITGGPNLESNVPLDWRDQVVVATGIEYRLGERWFARLGANHGDNPVPGKTIEPNMSAYTEDHGTVGLSREGERLDLHMAWEHAFYKSVRSERNVANEDLDGSRASVKQNTVSLGLSYRF